MSVNNWEESEMNIVSLDFVQQLATKESMTSYKSNGRKGTCFIHIK